MDFNRTRWYATLGNSSVKKLLAKLAKESKFNTDNNFGDDIICRGSEDEYPARICFVEKSNTSFIESQRYTKVFLEEVIEYLSKPALQNPSDTIELSKKTFKIKKEGIEVEGVLVPTETIDELWRSYKRGPIIIDRNIVYFMFDELKNYAYIEAGCVKVSMKDFETLVEAFRSQK